MSQISGLMLLLAAVAIAILLLGAHLVLPRLARISAEQGLLTREFLWALVPFVLLAVLCGVWTGALNAERKYLAPALSPGLRSLIILGILAGAAPILGVHALLAAHLLLITRWGVIGIAVSTTVMYGLATLLLVWEYHVGLKDEWTSR